MYKEIWRDIQGYEGYYMVSTHGRIKSVDRYVNSKNGSNYLMKGRLLNLCMDKDGYKIIGLRKNGKQKTYRVHRLVAQAFIPNPNNYPQVNHKDENPANNHVSNLEWCTCKYNINYGTHNKKLSESGKGKHNHHGKNNPRAKAILMFTLDGEFIRRFDCIKEALIFLGKHNGGSNIHKCVVGVYKQAYGYKWIKEGDN